MADWMYEKLTQRYVPAEPHVHDRANLRCTRRPNGCFEAAGRGLCGHSRHRSDWLRQVLLETEGDLAGETQSHARDPARILRPLAR